MQCSGLTTSSMHLWRVPSRTVPGAVVSLYKWAYLDFQLDFWSGFRVPNMSRRVQSKPFCCPIPGGMVRCGFGHPDSEQSSLISLPSKFAP